MRKKFSLLLLAAVLFSAAAAAAEEADPFRTIGSIVTFGYYEQDNNVNNGPEKIEWYVIDVKDNICLLMSRYGLDVRQYNKFLDITWEESAIRKWLNNDFYTVAFNSTEKDSILMVIVDNGKQQGYSGWDTSGGSGTWDRIFLLSYYEVSKGHPMSQKIRQCAATDFALAKGKKYWKTDTAPVNEDGRLVWSWWLRSPGDRQRDAALMGVDGAKVHDTVVDGYELVRPVLWLRLD